MDIFSQFPALRRVVLIALGDTGNEAENEKNLESSKEFLANIDHPFLKNAEKDFSKMPENELQSYVAGEGPQGAELATEATEEFLEELFNYLFNV
jgi:hypothetical protein